MCESLWGPLPRYVLRCFWSQGRASLAAMPALFPGAVACSYPSDGLNHNRWTNSWRQSGPQWWGEFYCAKFVGWAGDLCAYTWDVDKMTWKSVSDSALRDGRLRFEITWYSSQKKIGASDMECTPRQKERCHPVKLLELPFTFSNFTFAPPFFFAA